MSLQAYICQIHAHTNASKHTRSRHTTTTTTKTRFQMTRKEEAVCSLCSEQLLDAWWLFKQVYTARQRAGVSQSLTLNTQGRRKKTDKKTLQQNDRLLSQIYHVSFKRKSTQIHMFQLHPITTSTDICFWCLVGFLSWMLDSLYLPRSNTFLSQIDVYNCSGLQMMLKLPNPLLHA